MSYKNVFVFQARSSSLVQNDIYDEKEPIPVELPDDIPVVEVKRKFITISICFSLMHWNILPIGLRVKKCRFSDNITAYL